MLKGKKLLFGNLLFAGGATVLFYPMFFERIEATPFLLSLLIHSC